MFYEIQKLLIHCCVGIQNGVLNIFFSFLFAVDVTEVWFWCMLRGSPLLSLPYSLSLCERWFNLQLGSTSRLRAPLVQQSSSNQLGSPALIQPFSDHQGVCQLSDKICWFAGFLQHLTIPGLEMMRWKKRSRICTYFCSSVSIILRNYRAFVLYVVPCYAKKHVQLDRDIFLNLAD